MDIQAKISIAVHKWDRIYVFGKEKTTQLTTGLEEIYASTEKKCWFAAKEKSREWCRTK
jgi:hypothetical protein